jgi:hypothetical protein
MDGTMVTDAAVAEHTVANAFRQLEVAVAKAFVGTSTQVYFTTEERIVDAVGTETVGNMDPIPVFGTVALLFESGNFVGGQISVFHRSRKNL